MSFLCLFLIFSFFLPIFNSYELTRVSPPVLHGEGPHWHIPTRTLFFVDTFNATVLNYSPHRKEKLTFHKLQNQNSIGTVTPIAGSNSQFLISADKRLFFLDWDGTGNNTGKVFKTIIEDLEPGSPNNQCNDGKSDVTGQFWIGTLTRNEDLSVTKTGGNLYLIDNNGIAHAKLNDVVISNGIAWNRDNKNFFYIDSITRKLQVFDYDSNSKTLNNERILFDLDDYKEKFPEGALPDGMTIDNEDHLWVAIHGGGSILRINSTDGRLIMDYKLPASYVTSCAFGGDDLDQLYVTTSRLNYNGSMLEAEPDAGSLFLFTGLGVTGLPMNDYYYHPQQSNNITLC